MTFALLIALLPLLACGACLLLMCRPGKNSCHSDPAQEQAALREEIATLQRQLERHEVNTGPR
jgi:hypothetical protein